jgi:hypothetical protein
MVDSLGLLFLRSKIDRMTVSNIVFVSTRLREPFSI